MNKYDWVVLRYNEEKNGIIIKDNTKKTRGQLVGVDITEVYGCQVMWDCGHSGCYRKDELLIVDKVKKDIGFEAGVRITIVTDDYGEVEKYIPIDDIGNMYVRMKTVSIGEFLQEVIIKGHDGKILLASYKIKTIEYIREYEG